jgi:hypothetical protein
VKSSSAKLWKRCCLGWIVLCRRCT